MNPLRWILGWFGGGPLSKILDALNHAHDTMVNGKTEEERIAAKAEADRLTLLYGDVADARRAAAGMPAWMAVIGFMFGFGDALHTLLIGVGTTFQPLIVGGWLDWMLHIPPLPEPYATNELAISAFFFGSAAVVGVAGLVAGAIARRK